MGIILGLLLTILKLIVKIFLWIFKFVFNLVKKLLFATKLIVPAVLAGGYFLLNFMGVFTEPLYGYLYIGVSALIVLCVYVNMIKKAFKKDEPSREQKKNKRR